MTDSDEEKLNCDDAAEPDEDVKPPEFDNVQKEVEPPEFDETKRAEFDGVEEDVEPPEFDAGQEYPQSR